MSKVLDVGINFVRIEDYEGDVYTFKSSIDVVKDDRVVEDIKRLALNFIDEWDVDSLYTLYKKGWFLASIE
jgi:hypothetical protein